LSRFKKKIETPYPFTPHAYDALFLMALAVHSAGEASGTAIARTIRSVSRPPGTAVTVDEFDVATSLIDDGEEINYEGASGAVDLNEALEPNAPPYREPAESDG
jgi:branched-chain amino acid transport system substrate-binding protein